MVPGIFVVLLLGWMGRGLPESGDALLQILHIGSVCLIFLLSGWTIPLRRIVRSLKNWRTQVFLLVWLFLIVPLAIYLLQPVLAGYLSEPIVFGVVAMSALPTTITSCVALTRVAGGEEATALVGAVLANVLAVVVTPLLLVIMLGRSADIDVVGVFQKLAFLVVLPLALGQGARIAWRRPGEGENAMASQLVQALVLVILFVVALRTFRAGVTPGWIELTWLVLTCLVIHSVILASLWVLGGWSAIADGRRDRVAILFAGGQKGLALGLPLLSLAFAASPRVGLITLPIIVYHMLELTLDTFLAARIGSTPGSSGPRRVGPQPIL